MIIINMFVRWYFILDSHIHYDTSDNIIINKVNINILLLSFSLIIAILILIHYSHSLLSFSLSLSVIVEHEEAHADLDRLVKQREEWIENKEKEV